MPLHGKSFPVFPHGHRGWDVSVRQAKLLLTPESTHLCRPDNRSWRPFPALSGGQQALATLALSFALQAAYPSPLYFFDEIDCALESSTAARVADYIRSQTQSQYIVVSHKPQV